MRRCLEIKMINNRKVKAATSTPKATSGVATFNLPPVIKMKLLTMRRMILIRIIIPRSLQTSARSGSGRVTSRRRRLSTLSSPSKRLLL
jgi:hypothetical protein